jgi:hypothetical protein
VKKVLGFLLTCLKWLVVVAVGLEVFCFLLITASNYLIYGHAHEGSRVHYEPYALFLSDDGVRPTAHEPAHPSTPGVRTIWMFGGSTMRSDSGPADTTIPSYLAAILNRPGSPHPCTIVNYGENSFNSLIETKYLQKELIENPKTPVRALRLPAPAGRHRELPPQLLRPAQAPERRALLLLHQGGLR